MFHGVCEKREVDPDDNRGLWIESEINEVENEPVLFERVLGSSHLCLL